MAEFEVAEKANSGIIYRATEDADASYMSGPEFQVLDDAALGDQPNPLQSVGALYALAAPEGKVVRLPGGWNVARIRVQGWKIDHWLNGAHVVSLDLSSPEGKQRIAESKFAAWPGFAQAARGHIALQDHGDEVAYRSLRIRELPAGGEAIRLFDGVDLAGWKTFLSEDVDPGSVWSVEDGVLICKGKPTGYIRTVDDYENFVLTLDWRFNPLTKEAGNSGVLLRMTGEDKIWPRSIEAQLQSGNAGDFWLIDQFPMQVAPERTEGRNTRKTHFNEKPIGEWNRYEIVADHGTVVLKVNGEVLNEGSGAEQIPGKICLQSEGAEIQFRDIVLRPLP